MSVIVPMNFEMETRVGIWICCIRVFIVVSIIMVIERECFLKVLLL